MYLEAPNEEDCCNSGCNPCVYDIYQKYLENDARIKINMANRRMRSDLLSETKFKTFRLIEKTQHTSDMYVFKFQPKLAEETNYLGSIVKIDGVLPITPGQHVVLKCGVTVDEEGRVNDEKDNNFLTRAYTPISLANDLTDCIFDLIVKIYKNGRMSQYLNSLKVGDVVHVRGPYGSFHYTLNQYKVILMICIGTGIAPMLPILRLIVNNDNDDTIIRMLYGCRDIDSIIMRSQLRETLLFWNFTLCYYLSSNCSNLDEKFGETFRFGRITTKDIEEELNNKSLDKCCLLICGNDDFNSEVLDGALKCGIQKENVHVF